MNARAFLIVPFGLLLIVSAVACGGGDDDGGSGGFSFGLSAQTLASGGSADAVSAIVPAPDGRIFYAEQYKGTIQIILADGTLQPTPFTQVSVAEWLALDWGLTGLALDPDFETNHFVYAFYTEPAGTENNGTSDIPIGKPVIVRFTEENGAATERTVIVDERRPPGLQRERRDPLRAGRSAVRVGGRLRPLRRIARGHHGNWHAHRQAAPVEP
jgi:hypothetical protein